MTDAVPDHFVPTSTGPGWRGKWRCAYCEQTGWPRTGLAPPFHWTNKHGANCTKRDAPLPAEKGRTQLSEENRDD